MSGNQIGRVTGKMTGGNPGFPTGTQNGRIPLTLLGRCETQSHAEHPLLYKPAAQCFDAMTRAAKSDGVTIEAVALYRDYAGQVHMRQVWTAKGKPNNAAIPGTSSHGWGTASDVNVHLPGALNWMHAHGAEWGWDVPIWAQDGVGTEEAWHFQFVHDFSLPAPPVEVPVYVKGTLLPDADAYRDEGLIYAALRAVAKAEGWEIKTATNGRAALTRTGVAAVVVDYELHDGHAFAPVRELGKALGVSVLWDDQAHAVRIG